MPPKEKTPNHDTSTLSDREFLEELAGKIDRLLNTAGLHTQYLADLDERTTIHSKQLDHLDQMLHEVWQFIEEHKPALAKALGFLDPGQSMRDFLKSRKGQKK
jgi:hypothetical protein